MRWPTVESERSAGPKLAAGRLASWLAVPASNYLVCAERPGFELPCSLHVGHDHGHFERPIPARAWSIQPSCFNSAKASSTVFALRETVRLQLRQLAVERSFWSTSKV